MSKSVAFKTPPAINRNAESWVDGAATPATKPAEPMTRLTLDLPTTLHRRLKVRCAENGVRMAEVLRDLLEREFPA